MYVDLAGCGGNHYGLLKKLKLTGMQIMPIGELHSVQLAGPPNFDM